MILVAGAAGTVGAAVVARLLATDPRPRLRAFVHAEFDALRLRDQGVEAVVGDLVTGRGVDEASPRSSTPRTPPAAPAMSSRTNSRRSSTP